MLSPQLPNLHRRGAPFGSKLSDAHPDTQHQIYERLDTSLRALVGAMQTQGHDQLYAAQLETVWGYLRELADGLALRPMDGRALSSREYRVATLVKQGLTSGRIAKQLQVSEETVKSHRRNIRRKLGLMSSKQSLQMYLQDIYRERPCSEGAGNESDSRGLCN